SYKAKDGASAESGVVTVTLTITNRNDAPEAAADAYNATEDTNLAVAAPGVLGNDSDADNLSGSAYAGLTAVLVTGPAHAARGFALNADGSFSYTPAADYYGSDSFSYKAKDGASAESGVVTVTLTI